MTYTFRRWIYRERTWNDFREIKGITLYVIEGYRHQRSQSLQVLRHKSAVRYLKERLFRIDPSPGLRVSKWNSRCLIDSTMKYHLIVLFKLLHNSIIEAIHVEKILHYSYTIPPSVSPLTDLNTFNALDYFSQIMPLHFFLSRAIHNNLNSSRSEVGSGLHCCVASIIGKNEKFR